MRVLVTGASGFIGSAFVRHVLGDRALDHLNIIAFVRHSDMRHFRRLADAITLKQRQCRLVYGDLLNGVSGLCEGVDAVVNFAARTFVDHSIRDPRPFVHANVLGTLNILEDARRHGVKHFIQVSTDEVYGSIEKGAYTEDSRLNPTNPYAASKAGADALVISYAHTFGLHTTVTRTENNYGPYQHPQKVFPAFVKKAIAGEKLPIYGDGLHVRQWLWVDDHVTALLHLLNADTKPGDVFHVAGNQELTNIDLATKILTYYDLIAFPKLLNPGARVDERVQFIPDHDIRPGHDRRYALDCTKLRSLGWEPKVGLENGIRKAVGWYYENQWWLT